MRIRSLRVPLAAVFAALLGLCCHAQTPQKPWPIRAVVIATYTTSGSTTLRAARERPEVPLLCLTSKLETARRLTLSFGVHAVHTEDIDSSSEMVNKAAAIALRDGLATRGQSIVVTAGAPYGVPGNTNILRIMTVGE